MLEKVHTTRILIKIAMLIKLKIFKKILFGHKKQKLQVLGNL